MVQPEWDYFKKKKKEKNIISAKIIYLQTSYAEIFHIYFFKYAKINFNSILYRLIYFNERIYINKYV